jgi:hypothetical protein
MNKIIDQDAKTIVDTFFETKVFKDGITRDDMNEFQEFIRFSLQSKFDTYVKLNDLNSKLNEKTH